MLSRVAAPVQMPDHASPGAMVSRDTAHVQRSPDDARLYARVQTLQAEAQWRADLGVLVRSPEWLAATTVLDLGAGNGAFGRRLAVRFPAKSIVALEPDAELHAIGAQAAAPPNYAFLHGGFDPGLEGFFDVLLARGVLMYMPERRSLARWAGEHCAAALIMNNAPEASSLRPMPTYHAELLSRTDWSHPADRSALEREREVVDTPQVFAAAGFTLTGSTTAITELSGARGRLLAHHFLRASAEAIDAAAMTIDLLDELFEWSHNEDAHLTMGATWYRFRNARGPWPRTLS
jgi:trans-aconitate methyltransferase